MTRATTDEMLDDDAFVRQLNAGFNRRDILAVLMLLHEEVDWANGMEGGHVHGREAVRAYWTEQWTGLLGKHRVPPKLFSRRV